MIFVHAGAFFYSKNGIKSPRQPSRGGSSLPFRTMHVKLLQELVNGAEIWPAWCSPTPRLSPLASSSPSLTPPDYLHIQTQMLRCWHWPVPIALLAGIIAFRSGSAERGRYVTFRVGRLKLRNSGLTFAIQRKYAILSIPPSTALFTLHF